ncbi:hypothetical protein OGAPHI_007148 [Ogataea philodendri]|uniref:Uncharacterized protein n=1 Tax=Ogataea philodendri TaxID=1378263 RepID=A0A9P8NW61_9ASCO|nr:uncharacterized protein OGAPHI_007148 [Ogataea philodendri]KAH3660562.1 hypothetical protein OGAPHI_007148 [Ogataea philodendri]
MLRAMCKLVILDQEPPLNVNPPAVGPVNPNSAAYFCATLRSITVSAGDTVNTCEFVLSTDSTMSDRTPMGFVEAYSLSRKPGCQVLTEVSRIFFTTASTSSGADSLSLRPFSSDLSRSNVEYSDFGSSCLGPSDLLPESVSLICSMMSSMAGTTRRCSSLALSDSNWDS